jgi:ATP-dependent DNA helicase RecG
MAKAPGIHTKIKLSKETRSVYSQQCGLVTLRDLTLYLPRGHEIYTPGLVLNEKCTVRLKIERCEKTGKPTTFVGKTPEGLSVEIAFFNENAIPFGMVPGLEAWFTGKVGPTLYDGRFQMSHPKIHFAPLERKVKYDLAAGMNLSTITRQIQNAMAVTRSEFVANNVVELHRNLNIIHGGETDPASKAWRAVAAQEIFCNQLVAELQRRDRMRIEPYEGVVGALRAALVAALPFSLTDDQRRVIDEIVEDLNGPNLMLRLLQGEVGSGKTLCALAAVLHVVEAGRQAALLAPTQILAQQHLRTIAPFAERLGLRVRLLTGDTPDREREEILKDLVAGQVELLVGTHAIVQSDVLFKSLALAIVDEQHRFGTRQRALLTAKGMECDVLHLSATPIPQTLFKVIGGGMALSELRNKPPGRERVATRLYPINDLYLVFNELEKALEEGAYIFHLVPLVEASDTLALMDVQTRFNAIKDRFARFGVDFIHGQLKGFEKAEAMRKFNAGETRYLVCTTVVSVGVDVPDANTMLIEGVQMFGLSELHQLRGRIGRRAGLASTCIGIYAAELSEAAKARLLAFRMCDSGFELASLDAGMRGFGDLLGPRQAGVARFFAFDPNEHADLVDEANAKAKSIAEQDPELEDRLDLQWLIRFFTPREQEADEVEETETGGS